MLNLDSATSWRAQLSWRDGSLCNRARMIPAETAVALSYGGSTHAVMMATPQDLEDFAIGFSLNEGLIADADEIHSLDIRPERQGIDVQIWLSPERSNLVTARRRAMVGPVGCGLCGVESLEAASRSLRRVETGRRFSAAVLLAAMADLAPLQRLNQHTRAVHAAAWWQEDEGIIALREDVGRHNAVDKLAGALTRKNVRRDRGAVLLTSRVSVEMVQKAAMIGAPLIVAVSAPTSLAIDVADEAGITLVAIARDDGFDVFSHTERIDF